MKINFTKKEYQLLVTMIEISDWVMNAFHSTERTDTKEYRTLRNKILSYAEEMGMKGCYKKDGNTYYETVDYEENSKHLNFMDEYDEESFWEQLVTRLVERDYAQKYDDEEEVELETRLHRITKIEKRYADEINKFGLSNLVIEDSKKKLGLH